MGGRRKGSMSKNDDKKQNGSDALKVTRYNSPSEAEELCNRCHEKVYPLEKVSVGIALHRNCFHCAVCDLTLTLNTFVLAESSDDPDVKDIYCKAHAPKPVSHEMDPETIMIKTAVNAQMIRKMANVNNLVRTDVGMGWQYDRQAIEFEHAKELTERNRTKRPQGYDVEPDDLDYEPGSFIRRLRDGEVECEKVKDITSAMLSLTDGTNKRGGDHNTAKEKPPTSSKPKDLTWWKRNINNRKAKGKSDLEITTRDQQRDCHVTPVGRTTPTDDVYEYLPDVPMRKTNEGASKVRSDDSDCHVACDRYKFSDVLKELYCVDQDKSRQPDTKELRHDMTPWKGRSVSQDAIFRAQNKLELKQRQHHVHVTRSFETLRDQRVRELEQDLDDKMQLAIDELLARTNSGRYQGDPQTERTKITQQFERMREEKTRRLLNKLNEDERIRAEDMVYEQTQEILQLTDKKVSTKLPPPRPPTRKKARLYSGPDVFRGIDRRALQVARREHGSFSELVRELTESCHTTLEKVRSIFRWITTKDLNAIMTQGEGSEESPYYFLQGIRQGAKSYHELFKRLCSYAGILVRIIRGLSKSAGYRPGMQLDDTHFRNSWTAVYLDDEWHFVDCHWGARYVTCSGSASDASSVCYSLDEFYFLTDPEDHVYMHFPDEPQWQLLAEPLTREQFIRLPVVKSHFFLYGLAFTANLASVLETANGKTEVRLRLLSQDPYAFSCRLECEGRIMEGCCVHYSDDDQAFFTLSLPSPGVFYFTVFVCDTVETNIYNNVCSFRIDCSRVKPSPFRSFPKLPDGYGPTRHGLELGVFSDNYYVVCDEDKLILNLRFRDAVSISHKLMFGDEPGSSAVLDRLVFQRARDRGFVSFLLRLPERGIYVFSVYAARMNGDTSVLQCACRFLLQCNTFASGRIRPYPRTHQFWTRCRLHEPASGDVKLNKNVKFKLEVENADAVAVIVGQQWFYLRRSGDADAKLWQGIAHTGNDARLTADVYVRYAKHERDFFPLLEYRLVSVD